MIRRLLSFFSGVPIVIHMNIPGTPDIEHVRRRAYLRSDGLTGAVVRGRQLILNTDGTVTGSKLCRCWYANGYEPSYYTL